MQSTFGKHLLRHKQCLHCRVEHKKLRWIESTDAKPICFLYFFPYQFPVTGNQVMWLLSKISEKVKQSDNCDNFVYVIRVVNG